MIRRLAHNLHWKLLSVAIAVVLWIMVVPQSELVTSRYVPILYKNLPSDLEIGSDIPERVQVEIRGPAGKLTSASLADLSVQLDLAPVNGPGDRTFTVATTNLSLPRGVSFVRAIPSQLRLRFDHILTKDVPVQLHVGAQQQQGYRIVEKKLVPDRVRIAGPEYRVRNIDVAETDPIDLSGIVSTSEIRVPVYITDPRVHLEGSPIVRLHVSVEKVGSGK